ncbi:MAG: glycosyltransferase [archaeon]
MADLVSKIIQDLKNGDITNAYPKLVAMYLSRERQQGLFGNSQPIDAALRVYANAYLKQVGYHENYNINIENDIKVQERAQNEEPIKNKKQKKSPPNQMKYTGPDPQLSNEELRKLQTLKNKFKGNRIFIMGNGPSLNNIDLELLKNDYVFCLNRISLIFEKISWRPSFYTAFDLRVVPDNLDEFNELKVPFKFFATKHKGAILEYSNHYWYHDNSRPSDLDDRFEPLAEITGFGGGGTVTTLAIQLAFYMGFDPIVLIGCDASYQIPDTVEQAGPDKFKDGTKLYLKSSEDDDNNHFDPRYFGKGKKWHNPNVSEMHIGFEKCYRAIKKRKRTIVNATAGGALECMPRCDYKNLFLNCYTSEKPLRIGLDFTSSLANKSTGMRNYFLSALRNLDLFNPNIQIYLFCTDSNYNVFDQFKPKCASIVLGRSRSCKNILNSLDCIHYPFNSVDSHLPVNKNTKKVVSIHDIIPITQPDFPDSIKQTYLNAVKQADAIVCVSKPIKELVCSRLSFPAQSCFVSSPVVDDDLTVTEVVPSRDSTAVEKEINSIKQKFKLKFPYLLYPAAYRPHKNHDILVYAMRYVYSNLHLVLTTGEVHDPEKQDSLTAKIKKLNLSHRIHVLGYVDRNDFINLYKGSVAVVFPSLDEGFGIPVSEAQHLNIPVLASRCGALVDVAQGSLEIDPYNYYDIAEKVNNVHADENLRKEIVQSGKQNVRRFTKEAGAKGLLEAYFSCIGEGNV